MILVTVGGFRVFDRLVCQMDRIAGEVEDEVIMQIGFTEYEPTNCKWRRFMSRTEMEEACAGARLIIAHAGTGSILTALEHNKPLVLVPRLKAFGEVFDDHQLEIAREMEPRGITIVYDIGNLEAAIRDAKPSLPATPTGSTLVEKLKEYLDGIGQ